MKYYLDRANPTMTWLTRLAFPVQVVAKLERVDAISKSGLASTYRYRHGYFDGVLSQNSIRPKSPGIAMIEVEQPAQPFTSPHRPDRAVVLLRREQPIAEPLMIPLQIVVPHILSDQERQMLLTERESRGPGTRGE